MRNFRDASSTMALRSSNGAANLERSVADCLAASLATAAAAEASGDKGVFFFFFFFILSSFTSSSSDDGSRNNAAAAAPALFAASSAAFFAMTLPISRRANMVARSIAVSNAELHASSSVGLVIFH